MNRPKMKRTTPIPTSQILRSMKKVEEVLDNENRHHVKVQRKLRRVLDQRKKTVALIREATVMPAVNLLTYDGDTVVDAEFEEEAEDIEGGSISFKKKN